MRRVEGRFTSHLESAVDLRGISALKSTLLLFDALFMSARRSVWTYRDEEKIISMVLYYGDLRF